MYKSIVKNCASIALGCGYALFAHHPAMSTLSKIESNSQLLTDPTSVVDREISALNSQTLLLSRLKTTVNLNQNPLTVAKYVRPKTADNGSPFPKTSGYVKGYPIQFKNGLSSVTVDNSRNSSDIFVKLYAVDATPPQAVRIFFIRGGKKFTALKINPGNYDIRYRDLNSGSLLRTDGFNLEEFKELDGRTKFTRYTLILKKVGKVKTHPISETEF